MKRTNFDASSYTRYLRERANTKMYQNDVASGIPQIERKSIVSRSPAADLLKNGFLNEFSIPISSTPSIPLVTLTNLSWDGATPGTIGFNDIPISSPSNIINVIVNLTSTAYSNGSAGTTLYLQPNYTLVSAIDSNGNSITITNNNIELVYGLNNTPITITLDTVINNTISFNIYNTIN